MRPPTDDPPCPTYRRPASSSAVRHPMPYPVAPPSDVCWLAHSISTVSARRYVVSRWANPKRTRSSMVDRNPPPAHL